MIPLRDVHHALFLIKIYPERRIARCGICTNLESLLEPHYGGSGCGDTFYQLIMTLVAALAKSWPDYSGDESYPVDGEAEFSCEQDRWANPKRLSLLEHMLKLTTSLAKFPMAQFLVTARANPELSQEVIDEFIEGLQS